MNAQNITETTRLLGSQAKAASALMAAAPAARKNAALRRLATLLRDNTAALQLDNARDIERAVAAGLAAPMVDRLRLTPKVLETCAQGCEQLAAMADVIGEVIGMKQQPSGIRVGQMRVPIGVFGMIFESRPNVTIEAASLSIKSGNAYCGVARKPLIPIKPWRGWCSKPCKTAVCRQTRCNWCKPPTAKWWGN